MKNVLILSLLLITIMSCGGGGQAASGVTEPAPAVCTAADFTKPGLYCTSNSVYAALEPGMCNPALSGSDCPKPYNFCDTNNRCQVQPAQAGSQQIWFATDAIRPGVTVLNSGNDYIYNIMAKGYASLDDWCMSQAQQSTIPAMRNMASWTAMIIAQPDNSSSNLNELSGHLRLNAISNLIPGFQNSVTVSYVSPNTKNPFSALPNMIYDRNSNPVDGYFGFFTGLDVAGHCNTGAYAFSPCTNGCMINQVSSDSNLYLNTSGTPSWSSFSSTAGTLILPLAYLSSGFSNSCSYTIPASQIISFVADCNCSQTNAAGNNFEGWVSNFSANGGSQKPILCLANQS